MKKRSLTIRKIFACALIAIVSLSVPKFAQAESVLAFENISYLGNQFRAHSNFSTQSNFDVGARIYKNISIKISGASDTFDQIASSTSVVMREFGKNISEAKNIAQGTFSNIKTATRQTVANAAQALDDTGAGVSVVAKVTTSGVVSSVQVVTKKASEQISSQSASVSESLNGGLEKLYGFAIDKTANIFVPFFTKKNNLIQVASTSTINQRKTTSETPSNQNGVAISPKISPQVFAQNNNQKSSVLNLISYPIVQNILTRLGQIENNLQNRPATQNITQNIYNTYSGGGYSYTIPADTSRTTTESINSAVATLTQQINQITGGGSNIFASIVATSSATSTFVGPITSDGGITAAVFYGDGSHLTGITSSSIATSTIRSMISSTATGLGYDSISGVFSLSSGYVIPLTASTTEWATAYANRITSVSGPLSISSNAISISQASSTADGYLSLTDWNTFNNKVSSQWTTSGSNVYYTIGNIGVGTTTPSAKFAITGNGTTSGRAFAIANSSNVDKFVVTDSGDVNMGLNLTSTVSGSFNIISQSGNIIIQPGAGEATLFYQGGIRLSDGTQGLTRPAQNELGILANGSERIRVSSGGNIGIATTTPGYTLTVAGDVNLTGALRFNGSAGTSGMVLQSTGSGSQWVATSSLGISGGGGSGTVNSGTAGQVSFYSANGSAVSGTSSLFLFNENVGIGTTTPGSKLSVAGAGLFTGNLTANGLLTINGTGTSTIASDILISGSIVPSADITYTLGTPSKQWKDVYIGPGSLYINGQKVLQEESQSIVVTADLNQNLVMRTAGTGDIELNPSGTGMIQLKGNVQLSGGYDISTSNNTSVSFSDGIRPGNISVSANRIITTNTNGSLEISATGTGSIYTGTGNFGIATTTPGYTLTVAGDVNLTGALRFNGSAGTSGMVLQSTGSGSQWVATSSLGISSYNFSTSTIRSMLSSTATGLGYDSISGVFSLSSGYVIPLTASTTEWATAYANRITSVSGPLSISSNAISISQASSTADGYLSLTDWNTFNNKVSSQWTTSGSDIYYSTGNIGIATTTPGYTLTVAGDVNLTGALRFNGSAGTSGMVLQSTGSGSQWVATSSLGITGSSQWVTVGSDVAYTTGKVLIGTTTASTYNLDVRGTYGSQIAVGSAGQAGIIYIRRGTDGAATSSLGYASASDGGSLSLISGGASGAITLNASGSSVSVLAANTAHSIFHSNGNFGVGTTTPIAKLSVSGTSGSTNELVNIASSTNARLFTITSTGNVGIGSTTPLAALQITRSNSSNEIEYLRFNSFNSALSGDEMSTYWYAGNSATKLAKMSVINEGSGKAGFRFGMTNDSGVTTPNRFVITGDGYVGIGTSTSPQALLHLTRTNTTTGAEWELMRYSLTGTSFTGDELSTYWYTQGSTHKLAKMSVINEGGGKAGFRFGTTNDGAATTPNRFSITGDGYVGIGTSTPNVLLTIGGSLTTTAAGGLNFGGDTVANLYRNTTGSIKTDGSLTVAGNINYLGGALGNSITGTSFIGTGNDNGITLQSRSFSTAGKVAVTMATGSITNSSGLITAVAITPTYNQTGTAAGTDLLINRTQTAVGSGSQLLFDAQVGGSSKFVIDNGGKVGIGTTTPSARLTVTGISGSSVDLFTIASSTNSTLFTIKSTGYVGIGTSTPSFPLDVYSTVTSTQTYGYLNSLGNIGTSNGANDYSIRAQGRIIASEFNAVSDARLKDVQFDLDSKIALDAITKLQPVSFTWKSNPTGQPVLGLIAQDVELAIPNAVSKIATERFEDQREVSYNQITAVMIGAIKELRTRIENMSEKITSIAEWFGSAGDRFNVKGMVCVDDVCVTKDQFKQMLINSGSVMVLPSSPVTQSNPIGGNSNGDTSTTTPESISGQSGSDSSGSTTSTGASGEINASGSGPSSSPELLPSPNTGSSQELAPEPAPSI